MSYQVLARKWRPKTFEDMVGQHHVLKVLVNALDTDRLHHAYLFTGTRGVGKTTLARILAKCLNCEEGVSAKPCGICSTCSSIDDGRFIDLIEVDAASRSKVDETRDLMDNVQYAPSTGRYKVYLIDEVHMFSGHSFNALLKTLEEPPAHVKFLLATTEPKKIPVTVLSRCLQFNLKHLNVEQINGQLLHILKEENVAGDDNSTQLIAKSADGSMRDALSLLDQAIAYGGGILEEDQVRTMLGTIDSIDLYKIINVLISGQAQTLIECTDHIAAHNPDYDLILVELLSILQKIAVCHALGDVDMVQDEVIYALSQRVSKEEVQLYYQMGIVGRKDMPYAPDPHSGFQMTLIRMLAFRPEGCNEPLIDTVVDQHASQTQRSKQIAKVDDKTKPNDLEQVQFAKYSTWSSMVVKMPLVSLVKELADRCVLKEKGEKFLHLTIPPTAPAHLLSKNLHKQLNDILQRHFGADIQVKISIEESKADSPIDEKQRTQKKQKIDAEYSLQKDPNVKLMEEKFGAEIDENSITHV